MWSVALIIIAVANCNAELCHKQTTDLPVTSSDDHRIIGGEDTSINDYPFAVQILLELDVEEKRYAACGGTLVTKSHVLTAAHCFVHSENVTYERRPSRCTIREGTTRLRKGGTVHRVTAIKVHEFFDIETVSFDAAVVLMATPVDESVSVAKPIKLPDKGDVVPNGAEVIAVGWGTIFEYINLPAKRLQEVKLRKIKLSICEDRYQRLKEKKAVNITINKKTMMCAGIDAGDKGTCKGDSGGPLIYNGKIVGITSWGYGCGTPNIPGVFADVIKMQYWIRKAILELKVPNNSMKAAEDETENDETDLDDPGSTGSLSSKIEFATLLAPILYCGLRV